jgi:uncharacterized phage-associated protein
MAKHSYNEIADFFIALSNDTGNLITNLKLQKLMFYAQAWHLAIFEEPLFEKDFEAWVHGPVLVDLYHDYKNFKWHPIERNDLENKFKSIKNSLDDDVVEFLEELCEEYFGLSAYELERLTHSEEPWQYARGELEPDKSSTKIIDKDLIKKYYSQYVKN